MNDSATGTNPWQAVYEAMVTHALRGLQVVYDQFNVALGEWLNDVINHPIPEDWREEVARFVEQTERNGLEILPESIRAIEAIIESCIAGTDEFAKVGPAPRGPARSTPPAPFVETVAAEASRSPSKPQSRPARVVHTQAPAGRRTGQGEFVGAQQFFDQKLVSAKQHFAVLDQLLKAAAEKIEAAKPGEEADVQYEADMVQKHLFLYNEDLAVARDVWLRFNLSSDGAGRLAGMQSPVALGLPAFSSPAQAERAMHQNLAISRRLDQQNASMDALVTGISATETAANAASLVAGAGVLIVAAKKGGTWAVVKTAAVGYAIYMDTKIAETGLHDAGASDQTIRGVQLAAAVITLILLRRVPKRAAPQKPPATDATTQSRPEDVVAPPPAPKAGPEAAEQPPPGAAKRPIARGNPDLGKLIHSVAKFNGSAAEKVKRLSEGASKIANITFKRVADIPGAEAVFQGTPGAPGGKTPLLIVLKDGRLFQGALEDALVRDPSGLSKGLRILLTNMKEIR